MGGEGSMMAANQSLKSNRALKGRREKAKLSYVSTTNEKWVDHKKASPELLEEIKRKMKRQERVAKRRLICAWIVVTAIIISGLIYLINL